VVPEIILKERWMSVVKLDMFFLLRVSVVKLDMFFLLRDCSDLNKPFHAGIKYLG
jgi:hypothetical protein